MKAARPYPRITITPKGERALTGGHPWVYEGEVLELSDPVEDGALVDVEFPVKTYGSYTFPAGTYQALEVIIGAGMGHNWWCVMYPNMCFEGSVYEVVDDKSEKVLKDTLSETEYQSLMEEKNYKISWKWLDFWDK